MKIGQHMSKLWTNV